MHCSAHSEFFDDFEQSHFPLVCITGKNPKIFYGNAELYWKQLGAIFLPRRE